MLRFFLVVSGLTFVACLVQKSTGFLQGVEPHELKVVTVCSGIVLLVTLFGWFFQFLDRADRSASRRGGSSGTYTDGGAYYYGGGGDCGGGDGGGGDGGASC